MSEFEVPWAIENAKHSARLVRRAYQAQIGEGSGVTRPGDLKVSALLVPGTGFRVAPGGGTAQSRDSAPAARESYGPILNEQKTVSDVPGTGSGGGRRDLVILEITDPQMESVAYPAPTDPFGTGGWLNGANFNRITIIYGVGVGVTSLEQITTGPFKNVTGITLAAINWPANTGTINPAMIEDLRKLHSPVETTEVRAYQATGVTTPEYIDSSIGETWPHFAETAGVLSVKIPDDAAKVKVIMTVSGYKFADNSPGRGQFWFQLGASSNPDHVESQHTQWAADRPGPIRVAYTMAVPASMRGTVQKFYPRALRSAGTAAQGPAADGYTNVDFTATFTPDVL